MAQHAAFRYASLESLKAKVSELGLELPFADGISALAQPWTSGRWSAPNRLAVHPMEGCDGEPDGSPGPLTRRRYRRFAAGGAGLLWFEACAVVPEGRANPRQLWLHDGTVHAFDSLLKESMDLAPGGKPLCVLQLTHSGRYSRPVDVPQPLIVHKSPFLNKPNARVLADGELEALEEQYVQAASLAAEAGFDGVDLKACHGYLINELLAARTREDSRYGGNFENRTRLLKNIVAGVRAACPELLLAVRLNVYDAVPWPYGWGVAEHGDGRIPDLTEPLRLARELAAMGVSIINVTAGNPYYNPHINRPFDLPCEGLYTPDEHPLEGVARLLGFARTVQQAVPSVAVVATGLSWLRQYLGLAAEALVRDGWAAFAGVGREAFAHPTFATQILENGTLAPSEVCVTCSSCSELMRDGSPAGCVPRDKAEYAPVFIEGRHRKPGARRLPHPIGNHI